MKIIKLIQNETIKTIKKTSTKILIVLAIVSLIGAVGLSKLIMSLNNYVGYYVSTGDEWKEQMKEEISLIKKTIETETAHYDKASIAEMKARMETYEIALKHDINYWNYNGDNNWKMQVLSDIQEAKEKLVLNEEVKDSKIQSENEEFISKRIKLLENDDYSGYISLLKQDKKMQLDNKTISKKEYDDEIYLLELREKYNIYKELEDTFNWKESLYQDISLMKQNLKSGINQSTGKLLKVEEIEKIEDDLKIAEYRLENDIPVLNSGASERGLYDMFAPSFSLIFVSILMIIIAGSAISTEISKGTIKFLLFTPNKRWKVLLSKIISAVLILLTLSLILSILTVLIGNIFFEEAGTVYVHVQNGEVKALSNMSYTILYFLTSDIDIFIYMLFALMLSVLTKNTALSVGVSIACYIGSGTIMELINYYISADWVKFIPFNNLGLADSIFANNISYSAMQSVSEFATGTSVGFSLSVLAVCVILMAVTMFDSFNKKDIV